MKNQDEDNSPGQTDTSTFSKRQPSIHIRYFSMNFWYKTTRASQTLTTVHMTYARAISLLISGPALSIRVLFLFFFNLFHQIIVPVTGRLVAMRQARK
jgi:hypothetical protein